MIKQHALDEDPHGLFLAPDGVGIEDILARHGHPDDVYDVRQGFVPGGPLVAFLAGSIGFAAALSQKTAPSLVVSLCFLFVAALGLYRVLVQSCYRLTTLRRLDLMHIAKTAASKRGSAS